ncbi:MAG TPA: SP_1767 family glycosyltransferase [Candidatus Coprosoma intestinipullorum]|uniref:SP_1767 family glycosyltransferase n=1 Tax=Candidatus Coprosoma intestinipullorum TaxID=2840752 RepID=A0A9D0ZS17_9FIRM|nr:SP_1767 family glycosyltransferase [Candidatus Coprosoma intestinipullorum]
MDNYESLKLVKNKGLSIIRFGDGEFDIIRGNDIPYQVYNSALANKMQKLILKGSTDDVLICLPDVFEKMNRYNKKCRDFYDKQFFYQNRKILKDIENTKNIYGSTFISRPYIDLKDKSQSKEYFEELKSLWYGKDILIVEGKYTRSGEGNDLFSKTNSISRIIVPSKNAFDKKNRIEQAIRKYAKNKLVLLMVGPTAKIIISDLKIDDNFPNQMFDIGHIDSEYEWFKMKAKEKVKIPHKHTAEFNYDDDKVVLVDDKVYLKEIKEIID